MKVEREWKEEDLRFDKVIGKSASLLRPKLCVGLQPKAFLHHAIEMEE